MLNDNNMYAAGRIMKLIDKYILKQIIIYSLLCMGMFVFVLVVGKAIRDGADLLVIGKVSLLMVAELLLMLVLYVINYALPLGFLTSILLVLGRLSAQREIVAMKASGISVYRIALPILVLGFIGTCLSVFINAYYAPYAKTTYLENFKRAFQENPLQYVRERTFIKDFPGFIIYVAEKEGSKFFDCWVWEVDGNGNIKGFIKAKSGEFGFDSKSGDVLLTLHNGTAEIRDSNTSGEFQSSPIPILSYEEMSVRLPVSGLLSQTNSINKKLPMMTVFELLEKKKIYSSGDGGENGIKKMKIETEIQRKFAMAFSVLALVLLAVPLGIKASRTETYANFGIAVVLAMLYYGMMILISWVDDEPQLRPDVLIWVPNLLFLALGIYMLKKANRN